MIHKIRKRDREKMIIEIETIVGYRTHSNQAFSLLITIFLHCFLSDTGVGKSFPDSMNRTFYEVFLVYFYLQKNLFHQFYLVSQGVSKILWPYS